MMISEMKATAFARVTDKDWQEVAIKSLRGLPFEKLMTQTIEGIDIAPLYTKEQIEEQLQHTHENMLETIRSGTKSANWTIAQYTYETDADQWINEVVTALEKGNEAIVYNGNRPVNWHEKQLQHLATLMQQYPIYAYDVKADDTFTEALLKIANKDRKKVQGAITGEVMLPEGFEHIRTVVANSINIHHQGADIVTELAITLAKAVEEANKFDSFATFEKKFLVRFAVDTHFFMEIAKIRAFRMLWQTLADSYDYGEQSSVPVFSETSLRTYSKLDPYVNLLRAGNEAFSAVLGGTDILTVHPHNILSQVTPTSIRNARNIQLVIKEETFVNHVLDPAGGSYYLDTLTNELIEKAWALFQEIEAQGGYDAYIVSGKLDQKLQALYQKRMSELSHHQKSLIGTNIYADLSSPIVEEEATLQVENRLAEQYEMFRKYFETKQPKVVLLTFGKLKDFKPRADFVTGFLAAGGIKTEWIPPFESVAEGLVWMIENNFDYGVICIPPKETEVVMDELLQELPNRWLDVAGSYDYKLETEWMQAGIDGFIFKGQDQLEKFTAIKNRFEEEGKNAEA